MNNIILIGFMGSGKSTIGRYLSTNMNKKQIDTDWYIEKKSGMKISEIFEKQGEQAFRQMETDCLQELAADKDSSYIISVGGGLPMRPINRKLLRNLGTIIYLKAEVDTLMDRLSGDNKRPLLRSDNPRERIQALMAQRESTYKGIADYIITTDNRSIKEIGQDIIKL